MTTQLKSGDAVLQTLNVKALWDMGFDAAGVRVAVVDSGIDPTELDGAPPIWERDFTADDNPRDRPARHGTTVADCIRLIAPKCDLLNAKVVPRMGAPTKLQVAFAIRELIELGVDVINISLDFDADGCDPQLVPALGSYYGVALLETKELNREGACALCTASWDAAEAGVAVVVAAGNRWGRSIQCPAQSPGALYVTATWSEEQERYFWSSRSRLRRWLEWKVIGNVGRLFGTSFASGYTAGEIALLMPIVKELGWIEAKARIAEGAEGSVTTTATDMHQHLSVARPEGFLQSSRRNLGDERQLARALDLAQQEQCLASHMLVLETLAEVDPASVSRSHRSQARHYLSALRQVAGSHEMLSQRLDAVASRWL